MEVNVDRQRAGQFGLTAANVLRSLVTATASSRFIDPNYWRDPVSGNAFQIQVEIPQSRIGSADDIRDLPVMENGESRPALGDLATIRQGTTMGEIDRYNMQRMVSLTANLHGVPLGEVAPLVREAVRRAGEPPRGATVNVRGQIPPLEETLNGLSTGLKAAIAAVFLLLAANFQSVRLALAVLSTVPAVLCGVVLALRLTETTVNVQSYMGAIMATGIAVANAILLVTFAERSRRAGEDPVAAASHGAVERLRAILMTAFAMIAGMVPVAIGLGEGGEQTAPLGRAVIGGLVVAALATLTVLPAVYAILMRGAGRQAASLDPNDPESKYHEAA